MQSTNQSNTALIKHFRKNIHEKPRLNDVGCRGHRSLLMHFQRRETAPVLYYNEGAIIMKTKRSIRFIALIMALSMVFVVPAFAASTSFSGTISSSSEITLIKFTLGNGGSAGVTVSSNGSSCGLSLLLYETGNYYPSDSSSIFYTGTKTLSCAKGVSYTTTLWNNSIIYSTYVTGTKFAGS